MDLRSAAGDSGAPGKEDTERQPYRVSRFRYAPPMPHVSGRGLISPEYDILHNNLIYYDPSWKTNSYKLAASAALDRRDNSEFVLRVRKVIEWLEKRFGWTLGDALNNSDGPPTNNHTNSMRPGPICLVGDSHVNGLLLWVATIVAESLDWSLPPSRLYSKCVHTDDRVLLWCGSALGLPFRFFRHDTPSFQVPNSQNLLAKQLEEARNSCSFLVLGQGSWSLSYRRQEKDLSANFMQNWIKEDILPYFSSDSPAKSPDRHVWLSLPPSAVYTEKKLCVKKEGLNGGEEGRSTDSRTLWNVKRVNEELEGLAKKAGSGYVDTFSMLIHGFDLAQDRTHYGLPWARHTTLAVLEEVIRWY